MCKIYKIFAVLLIFCEVHGQEDGGTITAGDRYPVYRWTFDYRSDELARDKMSGRNGEITGFGQSVARVDGLTRSSDDIQVTRALHFNGQGGYVNAGLVPDWEKFKRSILFWIKPDPVVQANALIAFQKGAGGNALKIALGEKGDGSDLFVEMGTATWDNDLETPLLPGAWNEIQITHGNPGIQVFINGVEQSPGTKGEPVNGTESLYLGGSPGNTHFFQGAIDDVRLYKIKHQGFFFVEPRYQVSLQNESLAGRGGEQWYRGKALALRIPWNTYLQGGGYRKEGAGLKFNGNEVADMAVSSGASGVLLKMRSPSGIPVYRSAYNPDSELPPLGRDFAQELVKALKENDLWFAPNLSQENIYALAENNAWSKADSEYNLVEEILDNFDINMYQFRFDGFWGQDETYDPAEYNHDATWKLIRERRPEMLINFNRFTGEGAEDMADIETVRPTDGVHYWAQEDFKILEKYRNFDWATEVETPMGNDWSSAGDLTALPVHFLLNKLSALSAMGICTVIGFAPDFEGQFNDIHRKTMSEIGKWLIPRKAYLDDAVPLLSARVKNYPQMWYINRVNDLVVINLLRGTRIPASLPGTLVVSDISDVTKVQLVPEGIDLPFHINNEGDIEIALDGAVQDQYNTIIAVYDTPASSLKRKMPKDQEENAICVFPNPSRESVSLINVLEGTEVQILNLEGKILMTQKYKGLKMDISGLERGVYLIVLYSNGGYDRKIRKFIVI